MNIQYVEYKKLNYPDIKLPEFSGDVNIAFNPYESLKSYTVPEYTTNIPEEYNKEPEELEELSKSDKVEDKVEKWIPKDRQDYIDTMGDAIYKALKDNGISTDWTDYLVAQTALESAWGKSSISIDNNNYGGIKGKGVKAKTKEYNGEYYSTDSEFKSYNTLEDFANDYVRLLRDKYDIFNSDPKKFTRVLKDKGYYTAPYSDYTKLFNGVLTMIKPKSIEEVFRDNGIYIRVTSAYRRGSKTKQGNTSYHSQKDKYGNSRAYDIVPLDGDFDKLKEQIINSPEVLRWLKRHGFGILDETSPEMMKKTGATGKHFHIGPDKIALDNLDKWLNK